MLPFRHPSLLFISTRTSSNRHCFWFFFVLVLFLLTHGLIASAQEDNNDKLVNIGAILDGNSRIGKEAKTAMEIAVQNFNNNNNSIYKLVLQFRNSSRDNPLVSSSAANELIKDLKPQAIIGMVAWQEAALVADQTQLVPIISLATAAINPPLASLRWPFLVRMATNESEQIRCVANIIKSYQWRRVITIYEDDAYGGDSGEITLMYKALQEVGSEIEYQMTFSPFSSLSHPKSAIHDELDKLKSKQSRVFIVIRSSLPLANLLFAEAKEMGMMDQDSVWITTETITRLLDSVNSSVISSMQGVIGIKAYFSEVTPSFRDFHTQFRKKFRSEYPEEDYFEPGIYSLRAYDAISTVTQAMERLPNNASSKVLMESILSSNFDGLSGKIRFRDSELSDVEAYRIVNVVGKRYRELGFWLPEFGFSKIIISVKNGGENDTNSGSIEALDGPMYWPGGLERNPRGWAMPTNARPMRIGVPGRTAFRNFVKVEEIDNQTLPVVKGFCIDVFEETVKVLRKEYHLNYLFEPFNGSYEDLIDQVYFKKFDAVVGDVTILANRSKYVEFTQPYMESGLLMIVPVKSESQKTWMFARPFNMEMWIVTCVIFVYTMFVVWFLEHRSNPEFRGPWKSQLGTALWFTFSTIFFAHRERLQSNFTRVVIVVWLFVVLILTQSYTASLTSMLTVQRLEPKITDIQSLLKNNMKVGCDGDSFVYKYLVDVLRFHPNNIKNISSEYNFDDEFRSGNISATFLELPYGQVFLSKYCNKYISSGLTFRFEGFGFVFPQGSPMATDVSKAILKLSESGGITVLQKKWLDNREECLNPKTTMNNESLSLQSFWVLFLITGGTSTIVFIQFLVHQLRKFRQQQDAYAGNISVDDERDKSMWGHMVKLAQYFHKSELHLQEQGPTLIESNEFMGRISSSCVHISVYNTPEHPQRSPSSEVEMLD